MPDTIDLIAAIALAHQQADLYEREHADEETARHLRRAACLLMLSGQLDVQADSLRREALAMLIEVIRG